MRDKYIFVCYSVPLMKYLQNKGFKYHITGIHPKTNKVFYVFIKNQQLNNELKKWTLSKPT